MSKKKKRRQAQQDSGSVGVAEVAETPVDAGVQVYCADDITEDDARRMLARAAWALDDVLGCARNALQNVKTEDIEKAIADDKHVVEESTEVGEPVNRSRGRKHPILILMALATSAARQQRNTLKLLHPEMFGLQPALQVAPHHAEKTAQIAEALKQRLSDMDLR
ncbi:MAG: hypothetical protein KDB68_10280 [Planctomycetes bacterium]|nr:hypothetical protein [Planctomycetota bacterium]MCA8936583.1 hypothetical protein [Planctomycetota bacterium]